MTPQDQAIVLIGNYVTTALSLLIKTLEANGSLPEHQFEAVLREALRQAEEHRSRLDYRLLESLLRMLEGNIPRSH
jgi:hypothetical protein